MRRRARKPAEQQLVEPFRHRRGGAVRQHRLGAERDGDLEPLAQPLGDAMMLRAALVPLPVHAGRPAIEHLHPVGADVAHAGLRILGEHERQRDVAAAVVRPASSGSAARRACRRACTTSWHGASLTVFGIRSRSRPTIGSIFSASMMPAGICGVISSSISLAQVVERSSRRAPGTSAPSIRTRWSATGMSKPAASRTAAPGRRPATCRRDR